MSQAVFAIRVGEPELSANGLWRSSFVNWVTRNGQTYVSSTCTSAALWDSLEQAHEAGVRAVEQATATGRLPNLCEKW